MARLKLKDSAILGSDAVSYGDIGDLIFRMSEAGNAGQNSKSVNSTAIATQQEKAVSNHEAEFKNLFASKFHSIELVPPPDTPAGLGNEEVIVRFVFDEKRQIENSSGEPKSFRVVNIVVPDVSDYAILNIEAMFAPEDPSLGDFSRTGVDPGLMRDSIRDLGAIARESLGFIVICGCVN